MKQKFKTHLLELLQFTSLDKNLNSESDQTQNFYSKMI